MRVLLYGQESSSWSPLERALAARGHETAAAVDLSTVRRLLAQDRFPLLILGELPLPLCRELRALPETAHSYLLAATRSSDPEELRALIRAGADDLLLSQPEELLDLRLEITERRLSGQFRRATLRDEPTGLPGHPSEAKKFKLDSDLRQALGRGELKVAYQPFVDLASGELTGFEALLRWFHPRLGPLLPDEFLPVAEETGLIVPLGHAAMLEACRWVRALQRRHAGRPFKLSVNLSHRQFFQPDLVERVACVLQASGLPPGCLGLEITEGVMISHTESALHRFAELKRLGVQLYLDDFGKGYSSFQFLQRFPVDVLKIDSSFVTRIDQEPHHGAIVEAIVKLSHHLGMQVVAEGIERPRQAARLQALGCEYGQGFLYSSAVEGDEAERLAGRSFPRPGGKAKGWRLLLGREHSLSRKGDEPCARPLCSDVPVP